MVPQLTITDAPGILKNKNKKAVTDMRTKNKVLLGHACEETVTTEDSSSRGEKNTDVSPCPRPRQISATKGCPCERKHPFVGCKRIPAYRRLGPYMRARGAPTGGAGARSSQGPPQSTSIAMRPRAGNSSRANAADETPAASHRPDVYKTDAPRDGSVTPVRQRRTVIQIHWQDLALWHTPQT